MVVRGVLGDGVRIVEELRQAGARVVAVDQSPDPGGLPLAAGIDGAVALICVEGDDLHNLATALVARELRSELRIVVGLRNAAVGRALNDIGVFVVDVGQVSAPSVIEACLRTRSHELSLGEDSYLVTEVPSERSGTLAELYGDLAVLAVRPGGGRAAEVAPADDRPMEVGDVDVVVGRADAIRDRGLGLRPLGEAGPAFVGARAPRESGPRPTTLLRHLVTDVDRRLTAVVLGLVGLIVVSVTVLLTGYRDADGSRMFLTGRALLHGGDDRYGRLRRLLFPRPGRLVARLGDRAEGRRGDGRVLRVADGLRDAGHEVAVVEADGSTGFRPRCRRARIGR